MNRRILGIVAGLLLPPIGIVVFAVGAQQSINAAYRFGAAQPSLAWLVMLLGAAIVAAGILSARWSVLGIAIAGGLGVLLGVLQFAFPISIGTFNLGAFIVRVPLGLLPREAQEALLTYLYLGVPLLTGALLLGAAVGLSVRRHSAGNPMWAILGVLAIVVGLPVAIVGQSMLTYTMRTMKNDPLSLVVLLLAAVLLAAAAYSSRGGGLALVISGGAIAAAGLAVVLVPTLIGGPSAVVRVSQEVAYAFGQGQPLLLGSMLLATGLVALLLKPRTTDAVPSTPV